MEFNYLISQSLSFEAINELKRSRAEFFNETLWHSKIFSVTCYFKFPKHLGLVFLCFSRKTSKTNVSHCLL